MECTVPLGPASTRLLLGHGSSQNLAETLSLSGTRVTVVSDENVSASARGRVFPDQDWLVVPPGESSKCLERAAWLWSQMLALGMDRRSALVAVGGGVVGDLAGFAAATYLRGVPFYSIPTSLLAMVDASVGGKVGIDLPQGKNLVGQFYPAKIVAVDPALLATLPEAEWSSGMAEVIKHGILSGGDFWSQLLSFHPADRSQDKKLEALVTAAVRVKVGVVQDDPFEKTGLRATLNLGHSYGHAIEWCSDYGMSHGQAVALGLLAGVRLSRLLGILQEDFEPELSALLERWGLSGTLPDSDDGRYSWERISLALGRDKKNKDGQWCFVLPQALGRVQLVYGPDRAAVERAFSSLLV